MRTQRKMPVGRGDVQRRGGALVLSLVAVTTVVVLAASFTRFASAVANRQAQAVNRKRAFYLAEAGLAEAFSGFTIGKNGAVGTEKEPAVLGDGLFWVEATELDGGMVRLESTGMIGTGRAELALVAERGAESVASLGVFSAGEVSLQAGSLVDAYDSSKGSYASQADKSGAVLGSNGDIFLGGTALAVTTVNGDVTPGPDDMVTKNGTVVVSGSTAPAMNETQLPTVEVPEVSLEPAQVHSSPYPLVVPAGIQGLEALTVASGAQVVVQGPAQLVLGSLHLETGAELVFDVTQGPIELYVTDAFDAASGSHLTNSTTAPDKVLIQIPGETEQPVTLGSTGAFYGVVYAPEAQVELGSSFEIFGALVAGELDFLGAAKLHFDQHLAKLSAEAALPQVLSWRILEMSSTSGDLSMDPFRFLGVDRNLLPPPADAHAVQNLLIDYWDSGSTYHRYNGPEVHFDWSVVKTVIFAARDGVEVHFPFAAKAKKGVPKTPGVVPVIDGPMI